MNKLPSTINILKALFDIKPVDDSGRVNVRKIYSVEPVVNLAPPKRSNKEGPELSRQDESYGAGDKFFFGIWDDKGVKDLGMVDYQIVKEKVKPKAKIARVLPKISPQEEFETILSQAFDTRREIKSVGGKTVRSIFTKKSRNPKFQILPIPSRILDKVGTNSPDSLLRIADPRLLRNRDKQIQNPNDQIFLDDYQAILSQISQRVLPETENLFVGEPKKIDPISLGMLAEARPVAVSSEIENWASYATSNARNFQFSIFPASAGPRHGGGNFQSIFKFRIPKSLLRMYEFFTNIRIRTFVAIRKFVVIVGVVGFSALIFTSFGQYGISVKNEVLRESNSAVANLEQANENLRVFDFEAASNNFAEAYEEFSKAGESLNFMGASITSLFAELPGAGKLKSAKNLVEAGKLLAEAGKSMSEAVSSLSETSVILDVKHEAGSRKQGIGDLKKSLLASSKNLSKANALLSDISPDALPEDKRGSFLEYQSKLPELESIVSDAVEYTSFLENLLGSNGAKKYLVLFQNSSELRPTGGFPGTYAVVTFKDGRLAGFLVDDVYNLDGQLKENIIPPKPLQHITPTWGMRDASWFADFSVSAQKIIQFYEMATRGEYEAGPVRGKTSAESGSSADHALQAGRTSNGIDGVITMSPRTITEILKVIGPIEMPEYDLTINDENFLSTVQAEVEYGDNREQPKSVVMDMAPKLLEKIYSSEPGQWLDIFNVFVSGLDEKDILMYFKDLNLEKFAADKGFGGLVKNTDEDYLMVTFSNIKGSKTDRVTDNSIRVSTRLKEGPEGEQAPYGAGRIIHKLELTRRHNGGSSRYGFYNKQNPAYVRVLVPEGSELISISGNSTPAYKPLIGYSDGNFAEDKDLFRLESSFYFDSEKGVSTYRESGKTGFAFWFVTDPGEKKTVELEYSVPFDHAQGKPYGIYIQKQPGLEVDNLEFRIGESYIYNDKFEKDLELTLTPNQ